MAFVVTTLVSGVGIGRGDVRGVQDRGGSPLDRVGRAPGKRPGRLRPAEFVLRLVYRQMVYDVYAFP
jgi:hypothetical protein